MLRFLFRIRPLKNPIYLLAALGSFFAGAVLALHHPLWPLATLIVFCLWCATAASRPDVWLFVVPACLPFLNFSPWTGWLVADEFDILLLGALAGGYCRLAYCSRASSVIEIPTVFRRLTALLAGTAVVGLYRGIADAGSLSFDWFAGYTDALNSLRIFKSLGFALLFLPLLQDNLVRARGVLASQRIAGGIVAGLAAVTLAVIWERSAFPGILDFSKHYRTVALFWEMHVGGGAIDAYLALTTPFVVWALASARRPAVWAGAAALALLTGYACLTTFSRGVYFAVAGSLTLLGILLWAQKSDFSAHKFLGHVLQRQRFKGWRPKAVPILVLALLAEIILVVGGGSFMTERLISTDRDMSGRLAHWQRGLDLLHSPSDWILGKGLGRFPANYAAHVPQGEFSGDLKMRYEPGPDGVVNGFVAVRGPFTRKRLGGLFALTQRVNVLWDAPYLVSLNIRVKKETDVYLELCERHLLYDGDCQTAFIRVLPDGTSWQTLTLPLHGLPSADTAWHAPRLGMLSLSIANVAGSADLDDIRLIGPYRRDMLKNGEFSNGLAHWFPAAQSYFVPWHTDNFFLEVLVERGLIGLLALIALTVYVVWHLAIGRASTLPLSPYLAASLCAAWLLGLVSSFMDVPRVAFLYYLLTFYSFQYSKNLNDYEILVSKSNIKGEHQVESARCISI